MTERFDPGAPRPPLQPLQRGSPERQQQQQQQRGDEEEPSEALRQLLDQEEVWRQRRAAPAQAPGRPQAVGGAPPSPVDAWNAAKHGAKPQHVGPRARSEPVEALYKWDDSESGAADGDGNLLFDMFAVVGLKSGEPVIYYRYDAHEKTGE
jgi:hypothetical protein